MLKLLHIENVLSDRILEDVSRQRIKTKTSEGICVSSTYINLTVCTSC